MPPTGTLLSPTGLPVISAIPRESRQDEAAFLAAMLLGLTAQEADQLVAGMQAKRRELAVPVRPAELSGVHCETVAPKVNSRTALPVE